MQHAQLPTSDRLSWRPISTDDLLDFHRLIADPHVRRYLCDGQALDRAWCAEQITAAQALAEARGLTLWLLRLADDGPPVGFAGFKVFDEMGPAPQLLYAFVESVTGRGLATEAVRALIPVAVAAGLDPITAAVDGPNVASLRVLAKAGFAQVRTTDEGAFGSTVHLERRAQVSLEPLTAETCRAVMKLAVAPSQTGFVASNAVSIAQAHFSEVAWFRGIYAEGVPVGFVMLALNDEPYLWRLMIDARHQGRGYGRQAMRQIIAFARQRPGAAGMWLSFVPGEGNPSPFYRSLGFVETGEIDEGERVMRLAFGPEGGAAALSVSTG